MSLPVRIIVSAHLQVGLILYVIPKWTSVKGPQKLQPYFKGLDTSNMDGQAYLFQRQALGYHMVG
jgi:hypothetical protein